MSYPRGDIEWEDDFLCSVGDVDTGERHIRFFWRGVFLGELDILIHTIQTRFLDVDFCSESVGIYWLFVLSSRKQYVNMKFNGYNQQPSPSRTIRERDSSV